MAAVPLGEVRARHEGLYAVEVVAAGVRRFRACLEIRVHCRSRRKEAQILAFVEDFSVNQSLLTSAPTFPKRAFRYVRCPVSFPPVVIPACPHRYSTKK